MPPFTFLHSAIRTCELERQGWPYCNWRCRNDVW